MTQTQFTPEIAAPIDDSYASRWQGPLFVAGTWRSGTSLLYALLNKHPQIALMYEGDLFLLKPLFWARGASGWLARWNFWNQAVERHKLDVAQIPSSISQVQMAMEIAYKDYARQKGATIWGDKTVSSYDSLVSLWRIFPEARFIIIWRDPVAIFRSVVRAAQEPCWFADRAGLIYRFLMAHRDLKKECDRLIRRGARIHQIHYELLVTHPEGTMAEVCKFLEIPFLPSMAVLDGADQSAISEGKHHALVRSGKIASSLERSEVLPPNLKKKLVRYVSLWREESNGEWPARPLLPDLPSAKPTLFERFRDRALYRCLRMFDSIVVLLNCYAPLWVLRRVRARKSRDQSPSFHGPLKKSGFPERDKEPAKN